MWYNLFLASFSPLLSSLSYKFLRIKLPRLFPFSFDLLFFFFYLISFFLFCSLHNFFIIFPSTYIGASSLYFTFFYSHFAFSPYFFFPSVLISLFSFTLFIPFLSSLSLYRIALLTLFSRFLLILSLSHYSPLSLFIALLSSLSFLVFSSLSLFIALLSSLSLLSSLWPSRSFCLPLNSWAISFGKSNCASVLWRHLQKLTLWLYNKLWLYKTSHICVTLHYDFICWVTCVTFYPTLVAELHVWLLLRHKQLSHMCDSYWDINSWATCVTLLRHQQLNSYWDINSWVTCVTLLRHQQLSHIIVTHITKSRRICNYFYPTTSQNYPLFFFIY